MTTRMPRRIDVPIYNGRMYVSTTEDTWAALRRRFPDLPAVNSYGLTVAGMVRYSSDDAVVWTCHIHVDVASHVNRAGEVDWASVFCTIAHEAAHAAALMLVDWLGHEVTGTDEPSAYLVGWYFKTIMDQVSKAHPVGSSAPATTDVGEAK